MKNRKPQARTKTKAASRTCQSCRAAMPADAKFCPACGAPVDGTQSVSRSERKLILLGGAAVALVVVGMFLSIGYFVSGETMAPAAPPSGAVPSAAAAPDAAGAGTVDLTSMTPREAADRLFNRVMAAEERGDMAEVERFAPMALAAYERADARDLDGRYHVGLIALAAGNLEVAGRQIEAILGEAPNHLLGLILANRHARMSGDDGAAAGYAARFQAAHDAELVNPRQEYVAHRRTIDLFRADPARNLAAAPVAQRDVTAQTGSALYAQNCALCHGVAAVGSSFGPPLVDPVYAPDRVSDDAFRLAIRNGVKSYRWNFGNMPPMPGLSEEAVKKIVAFVRNEQRSRGIE